MRSNRLVRGARRCTALAALAFLAPLAQAHGPADADAASTAPVEAVSGGLRSLSEDEMSSVYGRGLSAPVLAALTGAEQAQAFEAVAGHAAASLGSFNGDLTRALERQIAQQQAQSAATGLQTTIKLAQTEQAVMALATPALALTLPVMPFGFLFMLPALAQLPHLPQLPTLPTQPPKSSGGSGH